RHAPLIARHCSVCQGTHASPAFLQTEAFPLFACVQRSVVVHPLPLACGMTQKPSSQTRSRKAGFASQSRWLAHCVGSAVLRRTEQPPARRPTTSVATATVLMIRTRARDLRGRARHAQTAHRASVHEA